MSDRKRMLSNGALLSAGETARSHAVAIVKAYLDAERTFQQRVDPWLLACFGERIARDPIERNHRFLEESLEVAQAAGCGRAEAHQLVDYVFDREVGDLRQEVGGALVTLAALCLAHDIAMDEAGETELARIWTKVEKIRAKQAAKPKFGPLPEESLERWKGPHPSAAKALDEVRRSVAGMIGEDPETWPQHGNAPLAIAAAVAIATRDRQEADKRLARYENWKPVTEPPAEGINPESLLHFYMPGSDAEDDADTWRTGTWPDRPSNATMWCLIVAPLGPREDGHG